MATVKKVIKKAQKGIKASPDSTAYYKKMELDAYESAARNMNSPKYSDQAFERAREAGKSIDRQSKKGKPGYDKDGFPIKKQKSGGVTKAKDGKWIQSAIKKPGALRAQLGAKPGKPIPAGKLAAAAKKPGKLGQRARLAQTLKKMKK